MFHPTPSPEEIFARRFGYGAPAHQPVLSTEFHDQPVALFSRPRPRSQRRLTPFSDEEEGNLVVLPSPPLRKFFITSISPASVLPNNVSPTRIFLAQHATVCVAHILAAPRSSCHFLGCRTLPRQTSVRPLRIRCGKSGHCW